MNDNRYNRLRLFPIHDNICAFINTWKGNRHRSLVVKEIPLSCDRMLRLCGIMPAPCRAMVIDGCKEFIRVAETWLGTCGVEGRCKRGFHGNIDHRIDASLTVIEALEGDDEPTAETPIGTRNRSLRLCGTAR